MRQAMGPLSDARLVQDRPPVFAYDHRGRQPALQLRHNLRLDRAIDIGTIDCWLRDHLGVEPAFLRAGSRPQRRDGEQIARAICERALVLYGELLRLCRMPVFDPGRVIQILPGEDGDQASVIAEVVLPVLDHFPKAFYSGIYSDAVSLLYGYMLDEPGDKTVATLHGILRDKILNGIAKSSPFLPACLDLCQLAHRAKIPFRHHGAGVIRFGWGARSQVYRHAALQADSAVGGVIAHDKQLTARYLGSAGFPVPDHTLVGTPEAALAAAAKHGWHVVVKPADCERSRGVTTDVTTEEKLIPAFERARAASSRVLVERHIPGVCHRILVARGEVVYAVKRNPKGVFGDGIASVRALIERANAREAKLPPWKRLSGFPADDLAVECLHRIGLTLDSVPHAGEYASLRPVVNGASGGTIIDVRDAMHPTNARLAVEVASALGLAFAGVDFITTDISRPWDETGGVINEVNFRPEFAVVARSLQTEGLLSVMAAGGGRIPVHLVTGGGDLQGTARALAGKMRAQGLSCHLASASHNEDGFGAPLALSPASLFDRAIALLMRSDVEQLLLVDEHQELLRRGFPVDRFDNVWISHPDSKVRNRLRQRVEAHITAHNIRAISPDIHVPQHRMPNRSTASA